MFNGAAVGDEWADIVILFNGGSKPYEHELPEGIWSVVVDGETAGVEKLYEIEGTIMLKPTSALIAYK